MGVFLWIWGEKRFRFCRRFLSKVWEKGRQGRRSEYGFVRVSIVSSSPSSPPRRKFGGRRDGKYDTNLAGFVSPSPCVPRVSPPPSKLSFLRSESLRRRKDGGGREEKDTKNMANVLSHIRRENYRASGLWIVRNGSGSVRISVFLSPSAPPPRSKLSSPHSENPDCRQGEKMNPPENNKEPTGYPVGSATQEGVLSFIPCPAVPPRFRGRTGSCGRRSPQAAPDW